MSDLLSEAYDSTNRRDDERLLIRAVASFTFRSDIREILFSLPTEDFWNPTYGQIWGAGRELAKDSRIITLDNLKTRLTPAAWNALQAEYGQGVRMVEVRRGVEYVRQAAKRRRLLDSLKRIAAQAVETEDYDSLLGMAHAELEKLDTADTFGEAIDINEALDNMWEEIENPPEKPERIASRWMGLNDYLDGGYTRGSLTVWGALPGDGKSVAMLNEAGFASRIGGYKVAIFSLEMGETDVTNRLVAAESGERIADIASRSLSETSLKVLRDFTDTMRNTTLRIYDAADVAVDFIRQQCLLMQRTVGLDVVVVDYLQIMDAGKGDNREQLVGKIAAQLKVLSRVLNVAIHTASQLNDLEAGNVPSLRSLRESKAIGQHADNVIMIHHDKDEFGQKSGEMNLHLVKNRRGRQGVIPLEWEGHKSRIAQPRRLTSYALPN